MLRVLDFIQIIIVMMKMILFIESLLLLDTFQMVFIY